MAIQIRDIVIIVIIVAAYFPVIYSLQKRVRRLEDEVSDLKVRKK